jgi:hypothetical protein
LTLRRSDPHDGVGMRLSNSAPVHYCFLLWCPSHFHYPSGHGPTHPAD